MITQLKEAISTATSLFYFGIDEATHIIESWIRRHHLEFILFEFTAAAIVLAIEVFGPQVGEKDAWAHTAKAIKIVVVIILGILLFCELVIAVRLLEFSRPHGLNSFRKALEPRRLLRFAMQGRRLLTTPVRSEVSWRSPTTGYLIDIYIKAVFEIFRFDRFPRWSRRYFERDDFRAFVGALAAADVPLFCMHTRMPIEHTLESTAAISRLEGVDAVTSVLPVNAKFVRRYQDGAATAFDVGPEDIVSVDVASHLIVCLVGSRGPIVEDLSLLAAAMIRHLALLKALRPGQILLIPAADSGRMNALASMGASLIGESRAGRAIYKLTVDVDLFAAICRVSEWQVAGDSGDPLIPGFS